MRRILVWIAAMMMLLTGCRSKMPIDPVGEGFSCTIDAIYQDMRIRGTLTRQSAGTLSLTFTEPATLNGLGATWDGEKITLSLQGLSFSVDPASVPESALGQELLSVLDAMGRGEGERTIKDGKAVFTSMGKHGECMVQYDAETGLPQKLSIPALPLEITFSDMQ